MTKPSHERDILTYFNLWKFL